MMRIRSAAPVLVAAILATSPAYPAPSAVLKASLTSAAGGALPELEVDLVNLDSGTRLRGRSDASGVLVQDVAPGMYTIDTAATGYALRTGPRVVSLAPGHLLSAALVMAAPQADSGGGRRLALNHTPVGCVVADEFPQFEATIEPMAIVRKARIYFRSASGYDFYYVEMVPIAGRFIGRLPRPKSEASPITYYVETTGADLEERRTPEINASVVKRPGDCASDRRVAPVVPGDIPVTVYSSGSTIAGAPAGFGGVAQAPGLAAHVGVTAPSAVGSYGGATGLNTSALLVGGAAGAALGVGGALIATQDDDEPGAPGGVRPASPSR